MEVIISSTNICNYFKFSKLNQIMTTASYENNGKEFIWNKLTPCEKHFISQSMLKSTTPPLSQALQVKQYYKLLSQATYEINAHKTNRLANKAPTRATQ